MTAGPPTSPVDTARLRFAIMRLARRLRHEADLEITPSQLSALATLDGCGPLALRDLAAAERVVPSTLTRIVAALEDQGLLERTVDPSDRRCALVHITEVGHDLLTQARDRAASLLDERLRRLPEGDVASLATALPVLEALVEDQ